MKTNDIPFVLCADDYGLAPGVGTGIRRLIAAGRLSATSCMTAGPHWRDEAALLVPLLARRPDWADVGLHFTLTDQTPAGPMPRLAPSGRLPSVGQLMGLAYTGRLDRREIADELARQLDAFTSALGRPPAYIDGHQHVHLLPGVREAVVEALRQIPGAYVRQCGDGVAALLARGVAVPKAALLAGMSGGLRALAGRAGVPYNRHFAGVYDLSDRVPFADLMVRFLARPRPGLLVMVHPGIADDALRAVDCVVEQRERELEYLASDAFAGLLAAQGLRVARFQHP